MKKKDLKKAKTKAQNKVLSMYQFDYKTILAKQRNQNILQIVQEVQETICKKQLVEYSTNALLSISGGQDSIFLLFCLSFLQTQIHFTLKALWCNHFWQIDSFYTTLHLTKYAVNLLCPLVGFLPLHGTQTFQEERTLSNTNIQFVIGTLFKKRCSLPRRGKDKDVDFFLLDPQYQSFIYKHKQNFRFFYKSWSCLQDLPLRAKICDECLQIKDLMTLPFSYKYKLWFFERTYKYKSSYKYKYKSPICKKICSQSFVLHLPQTKRSFVRAKTKIFPCICKQRKNTAFLKLYTAPTVQKSRTVFYFSKKCCKRLNEKKRLNNTPFVKNFVPVRRLLWQSSYKCIPYKNFTELFSENISRNWRHITTSRSSTFYTLDKVIYGHTLSDRVETILFNLVRGTGNKGVTSLLWKRKLSNFTYNKFYLSLERIVKNTHL